jgi:hypothetical protein
MRRARWLARRVLEDRIGHHQVMLARDRPAVAQPRAGDVLAVLLGQFGLPAGAHVVEQLRPGLVSSGVDVPLERRSQVRGVGSIPHDDVLRAFLGFLERCAQVRVQLGEQRDDSFFVALVMLRLE